MLTLDEIKVAEVVARNYPKDYHGIAGFFYPCDCMAGAISKYRGNENTRWLACSQLSDLLREMGANPWIEYPQAIRESAPFLATIIKCAEMTATYKPLLSGRSVCRLDEPDASGNRGEHRGNDCEVLALAR